MSSFYKVIPEDIYLTSSSMFFANNKGDLVDKINVFSGKNFPENLKKDDFKKSIDQ